MGAFDDLIPNSQSSTSGAFDDLIPQAPKQNSGIVGDIGTALKRGALQMPGMATGLADIAAAPVSIATGVNRPVSRAADWLGEQTGLQFGKWAEAAGAEYSPEMQQAQQNVEQAKGFFPTLGAVAQNPRVAAQVVAESLPATIAGGLVARGAMGAVAGAEKLAALRAAAGSADAAVANAARRELLKSGAIAAGVGEGAVSAGLQMAQTGYDVDPALAAGTALGAGIGTGVIGGLSGRVASSALGRKLGLSDIETSMAAGTFGENAGKAGAVGLAKRIGAGAIQEGLLEEAPQSYQEQVWQNLAAGKPLAEGAAEAAALGAVAGGVMGGSVNAISGPLSKAVAAAPGAGVTPTGTPAGTPAGNPPQDALTAERISPEQGSAQSPAGIASAAQPQQAPTDMPVPQVIQNAPAAPGSPSPVSAADPLLPAKQAEAAGAPIQKPQGPLPSANQTEVAIPPAQGPEAAALPVAAKPAKGIAAALQYPQQVTEGGGPLAQQAADMPLGLFGNSPKKPDTSPAIRDANSRESAAAGRARQVLDLRENETGWNAVDYPNGDGVLLISADGKKAVEFPSKDRRSGTEAMRANASAQAFAIDNPYSSGKQPPQNDLVITPVFKKKPDISPDISPDMPAKKATRIASSSGIAGALVTPQQPTFGGAPLEQAPVAMPIGEYGKRAAVAPSQTSAKPIAESLQDIAANADNKKLAEMAANKNPKIRAAASAEVVRREQSGGTVGDYYRALRESTPEQQNALRKALKLKPSANIVTIADRLDGLPASERKPIFDSVFRAAPAASRQTPPDAPQQPLSGAGEQQARRQPQPAPIMRRDDLVGAIMRVTGGDGIASNMALTIAGDTAGRGLSKLRGLFTNRGTIDLGEVATRLREDEGFDVRDGEHLSELIRAASFGDTAVSMERASRDQDTAEEKRHRDYIRQNAKKLKIKSVAVKFTDLEQRVIAALTRRHERAVELLDERAKKRFDAALEESYALLPEDVVDAVLVDVSGRGLQSREFWNQVTETLRYMVADAKAKQEQEALDAIEGAEPDWLKDDDGRGNQPAGGGKEVNRVAEEAGGEAGFNLAAQTPEEIAAAEAAAKEAEAKAEKEKKAAEDAQKKAELTAEVKKRSDAAADTFELGGNAMDNLTGQKDIFAAPAAVAKQPDENERIRDLVSKTSIANYGDVFTIAGDRNSSVRQEIMSAILGKKATKAESGVTAIRDALWKLAGATGGTTASKDDALRDWIAGNRASGQVQDLRFSQESSQDNQPAFYSQLSSAIASARVTSQPAAQWKAWINGNAGNLGIKKDEIEWSGVNDLLDMMSVGARNAASVEKEYGADSPFAALWKSANPAKITKQQVLDYLSGNGVRVEDVVKGAPDSRVDAGRKPAESQGHVWDDLSARDQGRYIRSAAGEPITNRGETDTKFYGYWQDSYKGGIPGTYREILVTLSARGDNGFKSNHWDEPNVLVHIRADEVIGADGKRYLRVGEIQSDWGQKGKKEGFVASSAERSAIEAEYHAANKAMMDAVDNGTADERIAAAERSNRAVDAYNARINDATIPQAPFVTDTRAWAALGIKRAIIHAINSGVDGVVFGTGEQNANLYDLSKQVSEINYRKEGDGSFLLGLKDRQGDVLPNQSVPAEKLEETVGKEVAQRMLDGEGADIGSGLRKLSGLDLKVGGEGMRAFYDQIIPSVANDVLKKVGGGKVESVSVRVSSPRAWMSVKKTAPVYDAQPGFTITPQMRAKIQSQGVPLFSFAGQQSATADQFQLDRAKQLLADGANANAVRQQTGWFKGVDGKWRYEIDDSGASLKAHGFGFGELLDALGKNLPLADVLDHPALFAAYPSIARSSVEAIDEKSQNNGELVTNKDGGFTIRVNAGLGEAKALSVMLHEIQHGIQNVEGFASGGNLAMFGTQRKTFDTLKDADAFVKSLDDPYKARIVKGWTSGKIAVYVDGSYDPYRDYKRLAGEVESRNVQQRQNFPADKRRLSDPLGTQDVAPEDVIVVFNGKDAKDAPAPFNTTRASAMAAVGASPADAAVFDMASEGKSAQEILSFLSKASRRPFNRVLAAALSRIGVSSTVSIDPAAGWRNNQGRNGAKFAASYSPKTDTVALYTPREAERHILHELVHAATLKAIARGGPAARQMQAIFDYVQRTGTMSDQYGMGNFARFPNETDTQFKKRALDEFTAELFTNPQFQVRLKQLPAPSGSKLKSAWDWVVRVIANLLGLKTRAQETALDRALSVGAALLRENASIAATHGGERFSQEQPFSGMEVAGFSSFEAIASKDGTINFYGTAKVSGQTYFAKIKLHPNGDGTFKTGLTDSSFETHTGKPVKGSANIKLEQLLDVAKESALSWANEYHREKITNEAGSEKKAPDRQATTRGKATVPFVVGSGYSSEKTGGSDSSLLEVSATESSEAITKKPAQNPVLRNTSNVHGQVVGQFSGREVAATPEDPDIRYSLSTNWQQSPVAPGNLYQAAKKKAAGLLTPERLDKVIYEMQDKFIDLRRIRDHIKEIGGTITDLNDAYLGEELYHKRLAYRTEQFLKEELQPFFADMKARGVSMPEFEKFLHARHAPEANDEMAKRNPNQNQIDAGRQKSAATVRGLELNLQTAKARGLATVAIEKALNDARAELVRWNGAQAFKGTEAERLSLSGMSNVDASTLMASLTPAQRADMNALAAKVDAINDGTLQTLERYGLMDKTALNTWRKTYQHYVPLHRDEAHPDSASHPIGQGFNVRGDASKRRTGSNQEVTNIFGHIAMQREAALTRGEKNRVTQKLYLMARQNPIADIWSVGKVPMIDTIDKATGFVRSVPDPQYKDKPNVITLRVAGKDVAIVMNEYNPQALRLAQSIKNLDVDDLHYLIPIVGKATRWFASINTQYNPIFGLINFARDVQTAALNLSTTEIAGKQKEVFKDTMSILGDIIKNKGRMPTAGKWAPIYKEFNEVGGTTGYRDLFLTAEDRSKAVTDEIKALDRGKVSQAAHAVAGWLSDYNEAMENATRLAAYKAAIDNGMSKERAASLAKNLTVNFNRKGRQTRELGALYAFFNAAVQGTARMAQTLSGPAGKKIMLGGVLAGAASSMAGIAAMGGGDGEDDEWSKIPEFVKERSLIIPSPFSKEGYFTIPMPLGFHFLPNIGRLMVEMAVYKDKTLGKQMASLFTVLADAFNPLGGSAPPMQIIAPTVMDPFIALAQNKDWTGKPIYVENFNSLNPQPGAARAKDSATPIAKGLADAINAVTGGTKYVPGGWSPTPDQIDYVIGQLTGGVGRELGKLSSTIAAPFSGDELPAHKIPLLGRLYGSTAGATGQAGKFHENIKRANEVENELKGRRKDGISVDDYLQDNPKAVELAARGNAAERQIRALRQMRSRIVEAGGDDAASKARQINERMATVMRSFNMQVERMQ